MMENANSDEKCNISRNVFIKHEFNNFVMIQDIRNTLNQKKILKDYIRVQ